MEGGQREDKYLALRAMTLASGVALYRDSVEDVGNHHRVAIGLEGSQWLDDRRACLVTGRSCVRTLVVCAYCWRVPK